MSSIATPETGVDEALDFRRILPILIIVLIDLLGLTIIIPLLPLYATSFGANALWVGIIATSYPLMQFIGAPLLGGLSDRFGRKPVLIISQIGTFVGFIVLGFASSIPVLILARLIDGISGANISAAQAALTDSTSERNRTQALGLLGAAFGLGFIIGPIIAFIALGLSGNDYRVPAFVAAGFSLISVLLTAFWFKETLPVEKRNRNKQIGHERGLSRRILNALRQPRTGILLLLIFMQQIVFFGFENLVTLFTLNRLGMNATSNTGLFIYVGILIVMVQGYYLGRWSKRFGERRLIMVGLALLASGLILTAVTPAQPVPWYSRAALEAELGQGDTSTSIQLPDDTRTGWLGLAWLVVAMIPTSVGAGMLSPSINSLLTKSVADTEYGSILGVSASLVSAANAISPLIGGALFEALGATAPFLIGGVLLFGMWVFVRGRIPEIPVSSAAAPAAQPGR
ncbi:MAG: tetracycline resistance MFS efflux pump [Anaerolineae bacterium]